MTERIGTHGCHVILVRSPFVFQFYKLQIFVRRKIGLGSMTVL